MTLGPSMVMMVKHRRKILRKSIIPFYPPPLPWINVDNIYASNAGAELTKKCDTKMLFGFLTPPLPLINVGNIYASIAGAELMKKCDTKMCQCDWYRHLLAADVVIYCHGWRHIDLIDLLIFNIIQKWSYPKLQKIHFWNRKMKKSKTPKNTSDKWNLGLVESRIFPV